MTPEMPKLTAAQLLAVVKDGIAVVVAFGVPLTSTQQVALLALAGSSTVILLAADATIRHARAKHIAGPLLDRQTATAIAAATATPATDPIRAATDTLAAEAEAEQTAHAANQPAEPEPGVDPATRG